MPATVTPVNALTTPVQVPVAGESGNEAAWRLAAQPLADQALYARERTPGLSIAPLERRVPLLGGICGDAGTGWSILADSTRKPIWVQSAITNQPVIIPITHLLPSQGTIKGVVALFCGGTGHVGLPAIMPTLQLVSWSSDLGGADFLSAPISIGLTSDASGSVVDYETVHGVVFAVVSVIDPTREYAVVVRGEQGANSIAGQLTFGFSSFSVTA